MSARFCNGPGKNSIPIVTMTLKSPLTILSITWSNSSSFVRALFKAQYVFSFLMPKLNKSGSPTMKFKYWSKNCAILSEVPASAVCFAKSSSRGLGIEERKLMYAGE
jgi:hypothetical protein